MKPSSARRPRAVFVCQSCGNEQPRWFGRCPSCGEWNSAAEAPSAAPHGAGPAARSRWRAAGRTATATPQALADVPAGGTRRFGSGLGELDRVLGGGVVPGSLVLIGGDPGIGKSTLLLQAAVALAG